MRSWALLLCCLAAFVAGAGFAVPAGVTADIYHYTDRDGVIHYTNVQPAGGSWRKMHRSYDESEDLDSQRLPRPSGERRPDPGRVQRYDSHIKEAAQLYQLPEAFIRAIVLVESNFFPDVISEDGAIGLMQLMPATALNMGVLDAFDPRQNVLGGTRYLRVLANRFNGDLVLTVAAYNAGEFAVQKYRGVPPYAETRRYVRRVLHHYYAFRNMSGALAAR